MTVMRETPKHRYLIFDLKPLKDSFCLQKKKTVYDAY